MSRLVLIRHGEAVCNTSGIIGGPRGCTGLSPAGVAQVERLRDRLLATREVAGAAAFVCSTLPRAIQTAALIAPALGEHTAVQDCEVCELHPGPEIDGLTWEEYGRRFPGAGRRSPDQEVAPGGESWNGFVARAAAALYRLADATPDGVTVIACHGGVVVSAMITMLRLGPPEGRAFIEPAHTSLTEFARDEATGTWRLERYNDTAHLLGP